MKPLQARFAALTVMVFLAACGGVSSSGGTPSGNGTGIGGGGSSTSVPSTTAPDDVSFPTLEASAGRFTLPEGFLLRWPIDRAPKISSPFGPRQKASEGSRPDFHRGIDIPGTFGEDVFAVAPGKIYKVVAGGESSEGGNVVTLEHALPAPVVFHGQAVTRYYTQYSHLDAFGPKAQAWLDDPEAEIAIGLSEVVGALGQSGTTTFDHVHFEVRLQTTCSLEYQVAHPDTLCADYGFDPHVNPLPFLLEDDGGAPTLAGVARDGDALDVTVRTGALSADFDAAVLQVLDAGGTLLRETRVGFNAREGFDASSIDALDAAEQTGFSVFPAPFLSSSTAYETTLAFDLSGIEGVPGPSRVVLEDAWGNAAVLYFSLSD